MVLVVVVGGRAWRAGPPPSAPTWCGYRRVFASVLVHEYAHCIVARRRGAVVEDILLLPIGGVSQLAHMPEGADDELAIAIVGPLTSLGLAVLAIAGGLAFGARLWPPTLFAGSWFARLAWLNIVLGVFNLLPALPMDGGRVLRAVLERSHDRLTATRQAGRIARVLAMIMIVGGVFYDFWFVLIGFFVYLGSERRGAGGRRATTCVGESGPPRRTRPQPGDHDLSSAGASGNALGNDGTELTACSPSSKG